MVKIQQWNVRHEIAAMLELGQSDSIYLIQDPYYLPNGKAGVRTPRGYHSFPKSRAGIYCSALQSCSYVPMPEFTQEDITVGIIEGGCLGQPTVIASIYLEDTTNKPIKKPTILPLMETLVDFCIARNLRLICGMDSNAHSSLWGSHDVNKRGEELEEFIFEKGLFVHNIGNSPTWEARGLSSIIDITISLNIGDDINSWQVIETALSDHNMISFVLDSIQNAKVMSRNYNRAKWDIFSEFIKSNLKEPPDLWNEDVIETSLSHFYTIIDKGLDQACPKHRVRKKDIIIWWNQDCEHARNHYLSLRNRIRRLHKKNLVPSEVLINKVKVAHHKLKYQIRRSKRESFRDMVRETSSVPEMSRLDKILDKKDSNYLGLVTRPDGSSTATLQVMLNEHFPGNENIIDLDVRSSFEGPPRPIDELEWITNTRISRAINQFKPHKSPGPDSLKPIVLRFLPAVAVTYLRKIFTACIEIGFSPSHWCHSSVIFMPKHGKKSYKEPRSFRPLSLSSFLSKCLQRLVVWRVEETALQDSPFHCRQYAFRKSMSTDHALTGVLDSIENALFRSKMVITIDIDIKGAFDNISTEAILKAMVHRKIEHNIIAWYSDYLNNRTCEAKLGGSVVKAKLTRGCPQGDVSSPPIAWNLPYDSLLETYDGTSVIQFGFADDGKLIITGVDFSSMRDLAQWAINAAEKWAADVGVEFSVEKSTVMFFNRGLFQPVAETPLQMYGRDLKWSHETKYLGVTFDNQLSFKQHIDNKIAAAKRKLMLLGNVFRNTWGPSPAATKWAYTGIVRPALAYGSIVWADKTLNDQVKRRLSSLQRLALLQIAPVRKSTPTAALELLYDIMPLHLFLQEHALKTAIRVGIDPQWIPTTTKGHQHLLIKSLPLELRKKSDSHSVTLDWEQNYSVVIGDGADIPHRDWKCYSDGSRTGQKAGSGAVILLQGRDFKEVSFSVGNSEVFQAEVLAILACAKILVDEKVRNSEIDFMVDSQPALMAIKNPYTSSDSVRTCKRLLNTIGSLNSVTLHYIRAHMGWEFNERADKLAKAGADLEENPENLPLPSRQSFKVRIETFIRDKWNRLWENSTDYRQTKFFVGGPSKTRAKLLLENPRDILGRLIRFITGHAFLRRQNAIVFHGVNPPPGDVSCRFCKDIFSDETPHHLITECDRFCSWRADTLGDYVLDDYPQWDVPSLVKFINHKEIILAETDT